VTPSTIIKGKFNLQAQIPHYKKNRLIIRTQLDPLRIFINVGHGGHRRTVLMKTVNHRKNSRRLRSHILTQSANEGAKVVSPTHRPPLPPGNISGTHFCYRLSRPQGHSAAGRIMSMRNSNYTIGNQSRDFPVCSTVPQPLRHRVPPSFLT
jgi:hypothetical protein